MIGTDPRDERLADVLDEAVRHLRPDPEGRLPSIRRGGAVRRTLRWAAVGTSVVVASATIGWAALWLRDAPPDRLASPTPEWKTYTQVALDWSIRYPANWHLQAFSDVCGHTDVAGALVKNTPEVLRHPVIENGCTSAWDMQGLQSDLVVVQLAWIDGPTPPPAPDGPLPLSLNHLESATQPRAYRYGAPQPVHWGSVVIRGRRHAVHVWFGSEASERDRTLAARILASIGYAPTWHTHHDETLGFTVAYPPAWGAQPFQHDCPPEGTRYIVSGVIISNLQHDLRPAQGCGEGWDLTGAPPDTVLIEIVRRIGGPFQNVFPGPDTKFPLSLSRGTPVTDSSTRFGAPGDEGVLEVGRDGIHRFTVRVWYGSGASQLNVEVIQRILESIALIEPAP